ncbi:hypothetical protein HDU97_009279 [Phlyctochytrium planicorne]|nr:hypothetical protein HDU97_009279 [Phlyctochytrium planicorne]
MKVSFNLIVASLIAWAIGSIAAPVSSNTFAYPYGDSDVAVVNTQHQETVIFGKYGITLSSYNVTVQLAVKNKAFNKVVGIRYTNSSWSDYYEAFATYTSKIDANYELWTLTIDRGTHYNTEPRPEYIVAGFASYNQGPRVWDPRNDYYVYEAPTQQKPLVLLNNIEGTTVSYEDSSKKIILAGSVRTYTLNRAAFNKLGNVLVRWTTDDWKTYQDFAAIPAAFDSWNFKIPVATADLSLPPTVQFAIQFKNSAGSSFWLNNETRNYVKSLKPIVSYTNLEKTPTFTGLNLLSFSAYGDLPLGVYRARFDNGEWKEFYTSTNPYYYFDTTTLTNGNHTVEIGVSLQNGPEVFRTTYPVVIDNHVKLRSSWAPKSPSVLEPAALSSWSAAASAGKVYIGYGSGTAARFSSFGTTEDADVIYAVPNLGFYESVNAISVEGGSVYTLVANQVHKFDEKTGTKDTTFNLPVNTTTVYGTKAVCYASGMVVIGENIFVSDSCGFRILKFTTAGVYISSLDYPTNRYAYSISRTASGNLISCIYGYPDLVIEEIYTIDFSAASSTTFTNFGTTFSTVKADDGTYIFTIGSELVFGKDGKKVAGWNGQGPAGVPGSMSLARGVTDLGDGTVFVVSVTGPTLERFDIKLI